MAGRATGPTPILPSVNEVEEVTQFDHGEDQAMSDTYVTPSNERHPGRYQKGKPKCRRWMVRGTICLRLEQQHGAADGTMTI